MIVSDRQDGVGVSILIFGRPAFDKIFSISRMLPGAVILYDAVETAGDSSEQFRNVISAGPRRKSLFSISRHV